MILCIHLVCYVAIITYRTGVSRVTFFRTGGSSNYCFIVVTECVNGYGFSRNLCVTYGTVNYGVVRAVVGTIGCYLIFLNRFALGMSGCGTSYSLSRKFCVTYGTVDHAVVADAYSTVAKRNIFYNVLALSMAVCIYIITYIAVATVAGISSISLIGTSRCGYYRVIIVTECFAIGLATYGTSLRSSAICVYPGVTERINYFLLNDNLAASLAMRAFGKTGVYAIRCHCCIDNHVGVGSGNYDSFKLVIFSVKVLAAGALEISESSGILTILCGNLVYPFTKGVRHYGHRTVYEGDIIVCFEIKKPCVGVYKLAYSIVVFGKVIPAKRNELVNILNGVVTDKSAYVIGEVRSFTEVDIGNIAHGNSKLSALYFHSVFSNAILYYFTLLVAHGVAYDYLVQTCVYGRKEAVINLAVVLDTNVTNLTVLGALGNLKHGSVGKGDRDSRLVRCLIVCEIAALKLDLYRIGSDYDLSCDRNSVIEGRIGAINKERNLCVSADVKLALISSYNNVAVIIYTDEEVNELVASIFAFNESVKVVVLKIAPSEYVVSVLGGMETKLKLYSVGMNNHYTGVNRRIMIRIGNDCDYKVCAYIAVALIIMERDGHVSGKLLDDVYDLIKSLNSKL